ncbi:transcription elongation factor spt6 [Patellaria atrata CBS 101060]|uniref:Transcription elongation factor Spt6 n=1 Tax=Patellaria atrata CBS 101060 TaxID=1346257 RepID=A0A9P4SHI8_9PEZI|nr:transcription elongation factor spt6 [Patellaria atrata CBS 101060]
MSNALLDLDAELGSEEEDEDFEDETGELRSKTKHGANGGLEDSSEEEDEDEDEEAIAKVREGFIVDEDEDEEESARTRKHKKRRRQREEEEALLDEEDLDLIGELNPELQQRKSTESRFKRLKRGHRDERPSRNRRGVQEIFDEDEDLADGLEERYNNNRADEFADFIEEDEFEDEEANNALEEAEVARPGRKVYTGISGIQDTGLDEASLEDLRAAFGDGDEYDWALQVQLEQDEEQGPLDRPLELKDVFEPSQLVDKMLTDEDNIIRAIDVPERFQLARKQFKAVEVSPEEMEERLKEETMWISNLLLPKSRLERRYYEPFQNSVRKVLEFMNIEEYEVPFIFQHRKDYLIQEPIPQDPEFPNPDDKPERLLDQNGLWEIFELDLKFKALVEKRDALQKTYESLKTIGDIRDSVLEELLPEAVTMEEIQDIQDYVHFQYSAQLKDVNLMESETTGAQKRARASRNIFEKLRASRVYALVRALGVPADEFAKSAMMNTPRGDFDDPSMHPEDMADSLLDPPEYTSGSQVLRAAKHMYAEELTMSPRMRKFMRRHFYSTGLLDCFRTEKGLRKITEDHPYYEFKYLRSQEFSIIARRPELYLRMLNAEQEGLVEVKIRLDGVQKIKERLYKLIQTDNLSDLADTWNSTRREVLDAGLERLERIVARGVKETLKSECENMLARTCRDKYLEKLDQAPFKPKGLVLGTRPRVLALSNGNGQPGRDAICWAWVEEDGRVREHGKFVDLRLGNPEKYLPDGQDVANFIEVVRRRKPDVIGVSGFSVETRKLYKDLQDIVEKHDLRATSNEDDEGIEKADRIDVLIVNDEVARLYHTSERSTIENPGLPPLVKYCIALARYLQDPMREYAALGKSITSISFDPNQDLLPTDKLTRYLETAMVDMVNLVGVEINEAINEPSIANLLPYVCGLGPRKAAQVLKTININGGVVQARSELVGDPDKSILPCMGGKVWINCSSFLYIEYDPQEPECDYMDNTRVHPEDYDLARKMAADALELDEEDVEAEKNENGDAAVVRRLVKDEAQEKVNDLVLEEYADQLEKKFHQKKRATLETIRAELQQPYEELRRNFALMSTDEIFTMVTGETRESLQEGMTVPVQIKRTFPDHIEVKLDCGIEGGVSESEYPEGVGGDNGVEPRQAYSVHQTVQAKLVFLSRKNLTAQLSFREDALKRPFRKEYDHLPNEWDHNQETQDKKNADKAKETVSGRAQRVIKHPFFKPFNSAQAEEYLGSCSRGDVVIRPSSKGPDHLAVTWKVSDNVYQHIDVLELDKDNEFSVGKTLKIGGKYTYSDLDELIANHVKAMAKKVDEMMEDEKYQNGSKAQTEQWLSTYAEANPKRSMYAFCINPKFPGYFFLCFKAGLNAPLSSWPVKVIPNAFELQRNPYPDMRALKNGFKLLFANQASQRRY